MRISDSSCHSQFFFVHQCILAFFFIIIIIAFIFFLFVKKHHPIHCCMLLWLCTGFEHRCTSLWVFFSCWNRRCFVFDISLLHLPHIPINEHLWWFLELQYGCSKIIKLHILAEATFSSSGLDAIVHVDAAWLTQMERILCVWSDYIHSVCWWTYLIPQCLQSGVLVWYIDMWSATVTLLQPEFLWISKPMAIHWPVDREISSPLLGVVTRAKISRLPFLAEERGKCVRDSNLTGFWKLFWNTRLRFENCGKIHGMGLGLLVRGSTVPAAFNRGNRTKDQKIVLDLAKSSKSCSILNAQRIQACAMRFYGKCKLENMMYA